MYHMLFVDLLFTEVANPECDTILDTYTDTGNLH